jgi:peptidoglycan hydrolase CwlO-like protein
MSSVLNVGVMPNNPVGNQIRRLESALEAERKDKQMLLMALEAKAPEAFGEYMRLKEEAEERALAAQRAAQAAQQAQRFMPSQPANRGPRY